MSVATAPTVLAAPVALDGYDYWGAIGVESPSTSPYWDGGGSLSLAPPAPQSGQSGGTSISGCVWLDFNWNGKLDSNEWVAPNVLIWLVSATDPNFARYTYTDAQGHYSFTGLPEGLYELHQMQPNTLINGAAHVGWFDPSWNGLLVLNAEGEEGGGGTFGPGNPGWAYGNDAIVGITVPTGYEGTGLEYNFSERNIDPQYVTKLLLMGYPLVPITDPGEPPDPYFPVVPEPGTMSLLAAALAAAALAGYRRRRAAA